MINTTYMDPDGKDVLESPVTSNQWDLNGNLYSVTDPLYQITRYAYDAINRRKSIEDPLGGLTTFTFDANSNLESLTDPESNTTTWTYDTLNRVVEEKNELDLSRYFAFDQAGDMVQRTDRRGWITQYVYDHLHRQTAEIWKDRVLNGAVNIWTDPDGSTTNEQQVVGFFSSNTLVSGTFTLTYSGQTTSAIAYNANAATVQTALEALSNIGSGDVSVTKTQNRTTRQEWTIVFTGALAGTDVSQVTIDATSVYDGVGAPTEVETTTVTGGQICEVQFVDLSTATDGTFTLTFSGQTTSALDWDATAGDVETALEALSNIDDVDVVGTGGSTMFEITFRGALAGVNVAQVTVDATSLEQFLTVSTFGYEFDAASQLVEATSPNSANFFSIDDLGRVSREAMTFDGYADTITLLQYFDANSNRVGNSWDFGTTETLTGEFVFDNLNRMTELTRSSDEQADFWHRAQFQYNAIGQFAEINRFVGDETTPIALADTVYGYDDLHRLNSILHTTDTTTWAGYDYTYDIASRITSIDSYVDGLSEYSYDDTNQLVGADHTGSPDEEYEYDSNGNRAMAGYDIDPNNQLKSDGNYEYTYDEEGNRETRTDLSNDYVTKYFWDHRNRLVGVHEFDDNDGLLSTVTNTYDAFDRWIRREVDADGPGGSDPVDTFFAHDGLQLALEFTDDNGADITGDDLAHVYSWGPALDQILADFSTTGDLNFGLPDHLGTPRDWVAYDPIGTETDPTGHQIYNAFGQETYTTGFNSAIGYTGIYFEITVGLGQHRNRWYDPAVARWVSEDPIGLSANDANINRYVANSPLGATDPTGKVIVFVDGILTEKTGEYLGSNAGFLYQGLKLGWNSTGVPQQSMIYFSFGAATRDDADEGIDSEYNKQVAAALKDYIAELQKLHPDEPVFVVGMSNGTNILTIALEDGMKADGVVFLGAALDQGNRVLNAGESSE